jgi:hypothetical protein
LPHRSTSAQLHWKGRGRSLTPRRCVVLITSDLSISLHIRPFHVLSHPTLPSLFTSDLSMSFHIRPFHLSSHPTLLYPFVRPFHVLTHPTLPSLRIRPDPSVVFPCTALFAISGNVYIHTYIHTYIHIHAYIHTHIHIHIKGTHTHAHMHT